MGANAIGEIPVIITGDYSQLNTALNESVIAAELGAQKIGSAFTGAGSSANTYRDALRGVSQDFRFAEEMTDRGRASLERLKEEYRSGTGAFEKYGAGLRDASQHTAAWNEVTGRARDELGRFAASTKTTSDGVNAISAAVQTSTSAWGSLREHLQGAGAAMSGAGQLLLGLTAPIAALGTASVASAAQFELGMRKVTSLMRDASESDFRDLSERTLELSTRLGVDAVKATGALYEAISAGVPKENAIEFLSVASVSAIAGVTDTKVAVDGLTTVLNAYHLPATKAKEVSDAMFEAVNVGKFTFEQLAASMGKASGIAAQVGISFQEILAAASTISLQGFTVSEAMTQIQSAIKGLIAPNKEMVEVLRHTEFATGQAMLAALGFEGSLQRVRQVVGDNDNVMAKAFGRIEGFKGLLSLTGENAAKAAEHLNLMRHASDGLGAATDAFNEINKSAARQWDLLKTEIKNTAIQLGEALLPSLRDILAIIKPNIDSTKELGRAFSELPQHVRTTTIEVTGLGTAFGTSLLLLNPMANGIERLIRFIPQLGLSLGEAALIFGTFSAAAIVTLDNINQLKERWDAAAQAIQKQQIFELIKTGASREELNLLKIQIEDVQSALKNSHAAIDYSNKLFGEMGPTLKQLGAQTDSTNQAFDDFGIKVTFLGGEVSKLKDEIGKSTDAKKRALEVAKETEAQLKAEGASAERVAEAHQKVIAAANALAPAVAKSGDAAKEAAHQFKVWGDWLNDPRQAQSFLGTLERINSAFNDSSRTVIGGLRDQRAAFEAWSVAMAKAFAVEDKIQVLTGHWNAATDSVNKLRDAHKGLEDQLKDGEKVIYSYSASKRDNNSVLRDAGILADTNTASMANLTGATAQTTTSTNQFAIALREANTEVSLLDAPMSRLESRLYALDNGFSVASRGARGFAQALSGGADGASLLAGALGATLSGGLSGGGRGGGAALFDPNNPNAGGIAMTGRALSLIFPGMVFEREERSRSGIPTAAPIGGILGGIDYGQIASGLPTALTQAVPAAQSLAGAVSGLSQTFIEAATAMVSTGLSVAAVASIPPPVFSASPFSFAVPSAATVPFTAGTPPAWNATPMTVNVYNPTVTNQSQLDQMVSQIQNAGLNTR